MSPLFFIAPVTIVVIVYLVLRSQSQSSKATTPSSTEKNSNDLPFFPIVDNSDQISAMQTQPDRHSHSGQDIKPLPASCHNAATHDTSSSSNSSSDSGSNSCSIDSGSSVDTSSF